MTLVVVILETSVDTRSMVTGMFIEATTVISVQLSQDLDRLVR